MLPRYDVMHGTTDSWVPETTVAAFKAVHILTCGALRFQEKAKMSN